MGCQLGTEMANLEFRAQVEWELAGLERADLILMYLQLDTLSPISPLELGLFAD
ncbi:MAG: nucleoside 2-deoxyribosyltransferase domain-containing protein [Candidatus Nitrosotenuis sp.]